MSVLAGILCPGFTRKPIKGRSQKSRISQIPVLEGIVDSDFTKNNKSDTGTELEAKAPPGTIGGPRPRHYQKAYKGGSGTELEADALAGTSENYRARLYQKPIKATRVPNSMITRTHVLAGILHPAFTKNQ